MIREPIKINKIELKNRLVMPPVATYQSTDDGKVTDKILDYYGKRAEGGNIGMIVTEHAYISPKGRAKEKQLSIASDDDIEGLKKLTAVICQSGTRSMAQLNHAGSTSAADFTIDEISEIIEDFARAAMRAKLAGYDGVEIHSAHGYLLNQFYSPLTNNRSNEYGGTLENRLRFHRQVIAAVRDAVGPDYPISVRLGGCDYMPGGSTIEDACESSKILEACGIDMLSLSGGMCRYTREGHDEPGYFSDMSIAVKSVVSIPVLLTGGVKTMADAEALLQRGTADMIGVGRELLKDANWADRE